MESTKTLPAHVIFTDLTFAKDHGVEVTNTNAAAGTVQTVVYSKNAEGNLYVNEVAGEVSAAVVEKGLLHNNVEEVNANGTPIVEENAVSTETGESTGTEKVRNLYDGEMANYKITGVAPYTDEHGEIKGELEIGSIQHLPKEIGEKFVAEGVAEEVA